MQVTVSDQKILIVSTLVSVDTAVDVAERNRVAAFGQLSRLMNRSKADEITLSPVEKRYDPLWQVIARKHLVFDRTKRYHVPASDSTVRAITFQDVDYTIADGRFTIQGVDHCEEDVTIETVVDAVSGAAVQVPAVLAAPRTEAGDEVQTGDAAFVPPEVKSSGLIQRLMQQLITPYEADQIFEETIEVSQVNLVYQPVFLYEASWPSKNKTSIIEVNGVTGEVELDVKQRLKGVKGVITRDVLLDIGTETFNMVVPGGAIALRLGRAIVERNRQ
ncbi:MAG: hypothetical protein LC779_08065 [Actinobacteria bacterium]|nr:hypothetical protein [Actinomycetota bacterium]